MLLTNKGISENIFVGQLPPAQHAEWETMVLIDVMDINDYDALATCSVNIHLYAKPTGDYLTKNVRALDKMEEALQKVIEDSQDPHYIVQWNWEDSDYDQNRQYHFNVVNIGVTIR